MNILEEAYSELERDGIVTNQCAFSVHWLNKSRRYFSMIRASHDRDASLAALSSLAANLKYHTDTCRESRLGELRQKADWLYPLTQKVWTALYKKALTRDNPARTL